MNRYLLSLGSNENKAENMSKCRDFLRKLYSDILFSRMIDTKAFGDAFTKDFYNQLAIIDSEDQIDEICFQLKDIEKEIGRQSGDKSKGIVKIDLDIIAINNEIVKKDDFDRPYLKGLLNDFKAFFYVDQTN